jgi:pyruvate,orthophosphate dikinase
MSLKARMPDVYKQFVETIKRMENYFHDMQDMEYTVEKGTPLLLTDPQWQENRSRLSRLPATSLMKASSTKKKLASRRAEATQRPSPPDL